MSTRSLETEIIQALAKALRREPSTIRPEDHLREDLGLDSLAVIELLFKLEEAFDLQIPDQDLPNLATVAAVLAYVEERAPKTFAKAKAKTRKAAASKPAPTRTAAKKKPAKALRKKA